LLTGVLLVVVGTRVLAGLPVHLAEGERLAGSLSAALARPGLTGYAAYGLAYGLTSLSCTLPLFLTVVGLSVGQAVSVSVLQFGLYALGMGVVICLAAVAVATLRSSLLSRLRPAGSSLNGLAGGILMLVGAYLVYYWLTFGNIAPGSSA
ncbi:MAG: cytochrome c biogenesis CcdA family protein, partial [Chloroflexota bacterium]